MKKFVSLSLLLAITLVATAQSPSQTRRESKLERETRTTSLVDSLVKQGEFVFVANRAFTDLPARPYVTLDGKNDLIVTKDKINSRLPFYGKLYSAPFGPTDSPLSFESDDFTYKILTGNASKRLLQIKVGRNTSNLTACRFVISVEVFGDATAVVNLTMSSGSNSTFFGYIEPYKKYEITGNNSQSN